MTRYSQANEILQSLTVAVGTPGGLGSGLLMNQDGWVATCAHVIGNYKKGKIKSHFGTFEFVTAAVGQASDDVAILRADLSALDSILKQTIAKTASQLHVSVGEPKTGERVVLCGYPVIVGKSGKLLWEAGMPLLCGGLVSYSDQDVIIVSGTIHHGNSGGPCIDSRGRVIGLVAEFSKPGRIPVVKKRGTDLIDLQIGYGFLVPTSKFVVLARNNSIELLRS